MVVDNEETGAALPPAQVDGGVAVEHNPDDCGAAAAAAAAAAAVAAEEEEEPEVVTPLPPLTGMTILPPRQNNVNNKSDAFSGYALALPPIRPEEPVHSLRLALSEVVGLAHFTNYRIEVETMLEGQQETTTATKTQDDLKSKTCTVTELPLISPFTGRNAVVSVPAALTSLNHPPGIGGGNTTNGEQKHSEGGAGGTVLDEFADLQSTEGIQNGCALRIVLERYDVASVKEHVMRLRQLLDGNAPSLTSLTTSTTTDNNDGGMTPATPGEVVGGEKKEESSEEEGEAEKAAESVEESATGAGEAEKMEEKKNLPDLPAMSKARPDGTNLYDFFYLASGEDPDAFTEGGGGAARLTTAGTTTTSGGSSKSARKKKKAIGKKMTIVDPQNNINSSKISSEALADDMVDEGLGTLPPSTVREKLYRLNQLEDPAHISCFIQYSGFHPPPPVRRMMGDVAYLEVTIPNDTVLQVTASTMGFFLNRCKNNDANNVAAGAGRVFDPSPASNPCFSHTLLDCMLQASQSFANMWKAALEAVKERSEISSQINKGAFSTLFRLAIRGDVGGSSNPAVAIKSLMALDTTLITPTWLVRMPKLFQSKSGKDNKANSNSLWNRNLYHGYSPARAEDDLSQTFGVDVRNGALRDWNEELQLAREMPTNTVLERLERARVIHKTMTEFGEASLLGVKAIQEGHIAPMNPNEGTRTQVYLHNNIFVSRALDVGPETFRLVKGDKAAKKAASREIQCIKTFHRLEGSGFHTLATVLIDYLGSRFICQSILPGILQGEKSHSILLGSVDIEIPMKCDQDFQQMLREKIGEPLNLLDRPVFTNPLTEERREECKKMKKVSLMLAGLGAAENLATTANVEINPEETMVTCAPLETKGIRGSDQRKYLLDFGRMTPRDANWVPKDKGGTGRWEAVKEQNGARGSTIPSTLDDEEWTMGVLRPELINQWIRSSLQKHIEQKRKDLLEAAAKKRAAKESGASESEDQKEDEERFTVTEEEQKAITDNMRLNVNVFLPDVRVVDPEQMMLDEEKVREAAAFLWDEILPRLTKMVRERGTSQLPTDGRSLTEFLHRNGVNCRYLGRLATLARVEEERDIKTNEDLQHGRLAIFTRKTMPLCWLELLECEMVARAAKHVLDTYLVEAGCSAAAQPAQLIASFMSAMVSEREETAAQTESRLAKEDPSWPDEDDLVALSIYDVGGNGDATPPPARSRYEIWRDIELEIGRRFRYNLVLFNKGTKRAIHVPLLRRVCQRTGVRLVAKKYEVGGRCYTEGNTTGGRLTASYPVSPVDVVEVVPLMKHTAAFYEGFSACSLSPTISTPPLQISLTDARVAMERAHLQLQGRGLSRALELAQEAASLYQRVTETGAHPGVVECVELMANVFLEAGDTTLAIDNGAKALGLAVQSSGFDGTNVLQMHIMLFQMMFAARQFDHCVKHLRAAMYILELSAGPRHTDHYDALYKLGVVYGNEEYNGRYNETAVRILREIEHLDPNDRIMEGITLRALAKALADSGEYKDALEVEKKANKALSRFMSKDHVAIKESDTDLEKYTKLAAEKGNRSETIKTTQEKEQEAEAMAANLLAEEELKMKRMNKKKKNKK